jgi:thiol-disulfide isomerase/thioredoxin
MNIIKPYNYSDYLAYVKLLSEDTVLAHSNYDESKQEFFLLNYKRMERIDKTFNVENPNEFSVKNNQVWVVISEPWCGDSAQILPILEKIALSTNERIVLKIVIRDAEPEWIERFTTNGSKSIPKLIAFDAKDTQFEKPLFTWGPRPEPAVEIYKNWKSNTNNIPKSEFEKELHTWYSRDKGNAIQSEIKKLIQNNELTVA